MNHVFQVKKQSAYIGYCEEFHGNAQSKHDYKKDNAYRGTQRKRRIINISKHLKKIEKPKVNVEKRVKLAKFHPFVVPEDQDYWMYQDPSAEDVKFAKKTSKKRKEIQQSAVAKIQ